MHIAVFTDTYAPEVNGVVTSLQNLLQGLSKDHTFSMYAPSYPGFKDTTQRNITVYRFRSISFPTYKEVRLVLCSPRSITTLWADTQPDIVHIHTPSTLGWCGYVLAKKFRIPLVGTFHTLLPEMIMYASLMRKQLSQGSIKKRIAWRWLQYLYNQCIEVTTPTLTLKRELQQEGISAPITVISNGINVDHFTAKKSYPFRNTIIHFGRISYEKNIDVLLHAMSTLIQKHPAVTLEIIGDGPALGYLKKLTSQLQLNNNVLFFGYLRDKELRKHMRSADVFCTASTIETQGIVVLEAMATGLPIVGVRKHGLIDLVQHTKNGFLAQPGDAPEIAYYLNLLLRSRALCHRMGVYSRKIASHHNLRSVVKKWEILYSALKNAKNLNTW